MPILYYWIETFEHRLTFVFLPEFFFFLLIFYFLGYILLMEWIPSIKTQTAFFGFRKYIERALLTMMGFFIFYIIYISDKTTIYFFNGFFMENFLVNVQRFIFFVLIVITLKFFCMYILEEVAIYFVNYTIYYLALLCGLFFSLLLLSTASLISTALCIFGTSISLYIVLSGQYLFGDLTREALAKYFLFSALSTGFILGGIKEFYTLCGNLNFIKLNNFLVSFIIENSYVTFSDIFVVKYAIILLFLGFTFKIAAFPGHFWAPEIYSTLPFALLFWIIVPVKFSICLILLKIVKYIFIMPIVATGINYFLLAEFDFVLQCVVVFSLLYGSLNAFTEQKIKRFIAYSSINQMGFLLICFLGCSGSIFGIQTFLYFLGVYVFNTSAFFMLICCYVYQIRPLLTVLLKKFEKRTQKKGQKNRLLHSSFLASQGIDSVNDFKVFYRFFNFLKETPTFLSLGLRIKFVFFLGLFILVFFSLAGIPPLLGFYSKFYVLVYAIHTNNFFIFIVALLTSLLGTFYYLRVIKIAFLEKDARYLGKVKKSSSLKNTSCHVTRDIFYRPGINNNVDNVRSFFFLFLLFCLFVIIFACFFDVSITTFTYILAKYILLF